MFNAHVHKTRVKLKSWETLKAELPGALWCDLSLIGELLKLLQLFCIVNKI